MALVALVCVWWLCRRLRGPHPYSQACESDTNAPGDFHCLQGCQLHVPPDLMPPPSPRHAAQVDWPNWLYFRALEGTNGWTTLIEVMVCRKTIRLFRFSYACC